MDIVYILGNGSQTNEEIRYSLRSLEKHIKYDRVFIVGECPKFLKNVIYIPYKENSNPRVNHLEKINEIIEKVPDLSENFLLMYDDIFFLQDIDIENYPNYFKGEIQTYTGYDSFFKMAMSDTKEYLKSQNKPILNFSVHRPVVYNKKIWQSIDWTPVYEAKHGLSPRCIYGNLTCEKPVKCTDCKYMNLNEISSNDKCFSIYSNRFGAFKEFLSEKYPFKCKFEEKFENLREVKAFLKDKRVAIVGNAESIFSKNNGSKIDEFDVIIRFNKGFITKPESQGTRTDIIIMACELTQKERKSYNAKYYINRMNRFHNPTPLHFKNVDIKYISKDIKDARASSGFIAINLCIEAEAKSIDLFGFDWEATPTFYNPKDYKTLHNYADEKDLVFNKFNVKVN